MEATKIAAMAETYQIGVAPHNPLGPVANAAALHFALSTPNFLIQEDMLTDVPWRCTPTLGSEVSAEPCLSSHPSPSGYRSRCSTIANLRNPSTVKVCRTKQYTKHAPGACTVRWLLLSQVGVF